MLRVCFLLQALHFLPRFFGPRGKPFGVPSFPARMKRVQFQTLKREREASPRIPSTSRSKVGHPEPLWSPSATVTPLTPRSFFPGYGGWRGLRQNSVMCTKWNSRFCLVCGIQGILLHPWGFFSHQHDNFFWPNVVTVQVLVARGSWEGNQTGSCGLRWSLKKCPPSHTRQLGL